MLHGLPICLLVRCAAVTSPDRTALVVLDDGVTGASLVQAIEAASIGVEWTRTLAELQARVVQDAELPALVIADLDLAGTSSDVVLMLVLDAFPDATIVALADDLTRARGAQLLAQGVPSLPKPVCPQALAALVRRLLLDRRAEAPAARPVPDLESAVTAYSNTRVLSKQQQMILRLYLSGMNDRGIAESCGCSEATVYEHWRRMARKAGGTQKSDAIADFHRFLSGD